MAIQNKIDSDQLGSIVNVNATDHGDSSEVGSLKYVCDLLGSESKTITLEKGTYSVGTSFTISSNVAIRMNNGAVLQIATGQILTINGPFEAGLYQVFDCVGTGAVTFGSGSVSEVYPEWWGAKGDGVTDNTNFINSAVLSGKILCFQVGNYLTQTIILISGTHLKGMGSCFTKITQMNQLNTIYGEDVSNIIIEGINFYGSRISLVDGDGQAIYIRAYSKNVSNIVIRDNKFENFKGAGVVRCSGSTISMYPSFWISDVWIINNIFANNYRRSLVSDAANAIYLLAGVEKFHIMTNNIDSYYQSSSIALMDNVREGEVIGNIISNSGMADSTRAYGIVIYTILDSIAERIIVSNNFISNTSCMGIYLQTVNMVSIISNILYSCDENTNDTTIPAGAISVNQGITGNGPIEISNNIINNNNIINSIGIQVFKNNVYDLFTITNNIIYNTTNGIVTRQGDTGYNIINGNNIIKASESGIRIGQYSSFSINISNNSITESFWGVSGNGIATTGITGININNNTIYKCNVGIKFYLIQKAIIDANNIFEVKNTGIRLTGEQYIVSNNLVQGQSDPVPSGYGVYLDCEGVTNSQIVVVGNQIGDNFYLGNFINSDPGIHSSNMIAGVGIRSVAGSPSGVLKPLCVGEMCIDTTGPHWYIAHGLLNTSWTALN